MARRINQAAVDRAARNASRIARTTDAKVDVNRLSSRTLEQIVRDSAHSTPLSRSAASELARRGPGRK